MFLLGNLPCERLDPIDMASLSAVDLPGGATLADQVCQDHFEHIRLQLKEEIPRSDLKSIIQLYYEQIGYNCINEEYVGDGFMIVVENDDTCLLVMAVIETENILNIAITEQN
jgi:hypothetical protein